MRVKGAIRCAPRAQRPIPSCHSRYAPGRVALGWRDLRGALPADAVAQPRLGGKRGLLGVGNCENLVRALIPEANGEIHLEKKQ